MKGTDAAPRGNGSPSPVIGAVKVACALLIRRDHLLAPQTRIKNFAVAGNHRPEKPGICSNQRAPDPGVRFPIVRSAAFDASPACAAAFVVLPRVVRRLCPANRTDGR